MREVLKACEAGRARLVVVAVNLEMDAAASASASASASEAEAEDPAVSVDGAVRAVLEACAAAAPPIPAVFALTRKNLGRAVGKTLRVAAAALLSFEALRGLPQRAVALSAALKHAYNARASASAATAASASPAPRAVLHSTLNPTAGEWLPWQRSPA